MIIYPTMELLNGRCVSLRKGQLDDPMIWHVDPVKTARDWAAAGASWMHITDFEGIAGTDQNNDLLEQIIRVAGIPVQLGGGFRTADSVSRWIDKGAGRIVLSTMASKEPETVLRLASQYPDQIVLAVDVKGGQVVTDGWRSVSAFAPSGFIAAFDSAPLAGIIVTDIDNDMDGVDAQLGLISGLAANARTPVIASGIVRSMDDISRLKYVSNISGAILGRALFNKSVDLAAALQLTSEAKEQVAAFE
ncbi:MAG: 1-(5-phosphoribosyl)-5-[(5-phosphoribosylamino)methylideneamino] imidazole-4-carboxamide isomerase [Sulfitobacter sp.]